MPELYNGLNQLLGHPTIIYLSASPWQLYSFLRPFTNKYYPPGQIVLRDMSYMELSSFLMSLTVGTQEFKQDEMEKIHRWFPKKKFLCTGDSTQTDPEAYGTM
jgi:phosphatidate phosphatase APP1